MYKVLITKKAQSLMADLILLIITPFIPCFCEGQLGKAALQEYYEI